VFDEDSVRDAEDVDADDRLRTPADITTVDHDVVPFGDDDARRVVEVGREVRSNFFEASAPGWNSGIVLDVVGGEDCVQKREVTVVEETGEGLENERFVGGERGVAHGLILSLDRNYFMSGCLFDEHGDDAGRHEIGHGSGEHGAEAEAGEVVAAFWDESADAADLNADGAEVGEAAEGEGGDGEGARGEKMLLLAEISVGDQLVEHGTGAEEVAD
jgi:hypothetical protein